MARISAERRQLYRELDVPKADWGKPSGAILAFAHALTVPAGVHVRKPLRLKPFQIDFVRDIYNPLQEDGRRQRRQAILSIARRNGKTLMAAVLVLAHLVGPVKKPNSTIVSAATSRRQAKLVFRYVVDIINAAPHLRRRLKAIDTTSRVVNKADGSAYEAIAAEAGGQFGMGIDLAIYDELSQATNRSLYDALMTSLGSQPEPLMLIISTQAPTDQHILSELIDYGERVNAGIITDPSFTSHLYTHPKELPITDRRGWKQANPGLGDYRDELELRQVVKRAVELPSEESTVRVFYLNQRVRAEAPYLSPSVYDRNNGPVDRSIFTDGRPVYGGLDLSARTDLTAFVLAAEDDAANVHLLPFAWTPRDTVLARTLRDRAPYDAWIRQGFLFETPGATVDYDWAAMQIGEIIAPMNVIRCDYDRWRIDIFRQALARIGVALALVERGQGFRDQSPCVEAFEELALAGRLRHGGHPLLRWAFANCVVSRDPAGSRKLNKEKAYGRIDPAVAAIMAVGGMKAGAPAVEIAAMIA